MNYEDIIHSLKEGNVPPKGTSEICVGRDLEIAEIERLFEKIENNKAATKFIEGDYGRGKSFLLKIIEERAFKRNFVVSKITITRDVPFNKFEEVYKNIVQNLKCKTGTSLEHIINRWLSDLKYTAMEETSDPLKQNNIIRQNMKNDLENARKYEDSFATAIEKYYDAITSGNYEIAHHAQAWLRGNSNIPASMKKQFGVKGGVTKENTFMFLEAVAAFLKSLGYNGLVILFDEVEYIRSLHRKSLRKTAYDYIRYIYDECNSGNFENTLFVFAGTSEFFEDEKRGVPSYPALYGRLENPLNDSLKDLRKPIIKLGGWKKDELRELSPKLIKMHSEVYNWDAHSEMSSYVEGIINLRETKASLEGGEINPRKFIKDFIYVLDTMQQNPNELNSKEDVLNLFEKIEIEEEW